MSGTRGNQKKQGSAKDCVGRDGRHAGKRENICRNVAFCVEQTTIVPFNRSRQHLGSAGWIGDDLLPEHPAAKALCNNINRNQLHLTNSYQKRASEDCIKEAYGAL
jgi:hypothetical protein